MTSQTKLEVTKTIKEIFVTGKTEMGCVWLMLIIGFAFGFFIRSCSK
jgi:hypothetical protein